MEKISAINKIGHIASLKCPNCGQGKVFYGNKIPFFGIPKMRETCEVCHYKFDREPGYFLGAMYVSYGLAVFEGIVAFLLAKFLIFGLSALSLAMITAGVIVFFAMWNFKLARVIWMNIFPN
jgi:hypothetical protein